jgi:hypothetical protein
VGALLEKMCVGPIPSLSPEIKYAEDDMITFVVTSRIRSVQRLSIVSY